MQYAKQSQRLEKDFAAYVSWYSLWSLLHKNFHYAQMSMLPFHLVPVIHCRDVDPSKRQTRVFLWYLPYII